MQYYGWSNTLWSCIAAYVTFATPYAIFVFQQYFGFHADGDR